MVRYGSGTEENEWGEREFLDRLVEHFTSGKWEAGDKTHGTENVCSSTLCARHAWQCVARAFVCRNMFSDIMWQNGAYLFLSKILDLETSIYLKQPREQICSVSLVF